MSYLWPSPLDATYRRETAEESTCPPISVDVYGQPWQPPLTDTGAFMGQSVDHSQSINYHFCPIVLGFDSIIEEINNEIPFYHPSFVNEPEENSFYDLPTEIWAPKEHLNARWSQASQGDIHSQRSSASWDQSQAGSTLGFEQYAPPAFRHAWVPGPGQTIESYNANQSRRQCCTPTLDPFGKEYRMDMLPPLGFEGGCTNQYLSQTIGQKIGYDGKQISKSFHGNSSTTSPVLPQRRLTVGPCWPLTAGNICTYKEPPDWTIHLLEMPQGSNDGLSSFCNAVKKIREDYPFSNPNYNSGKIWSITTAYPNQLHCNTSFTIYVHINGVHHPLILTPNASCRVKDFIREILHHTNQYPPQEEFFLRVCGSDEFLQNDCTLGNHETIQKTNSDVHLRLHKESNLNPCLARTFDDDQCHFDLNERLDYAYVWRTSRQILSAAILKYCNQLSCLVQNQCPLSAVMKEVKTICYLLSCVETKEIMDAVQALNFASVQRTQPYASYFQQGKLETAAVELSRAIAHLIYLYSRSFHTDFQAASLLASVPSTEAILDPQLSFTLHAGHNIPEEWTQSYKSFSVSCLITYSGKKLCQVKSCRQVKAYKSLFYSVTWNEKITFPLHIQSLPQETMLTIKLYGVADPTKTSILLGWTCLPLYQKQWFIYGTILLGLALHSEPPDIITPAVHDLSLPGLVTLQITFPEMQHRFVKPEFEQKRNNVPTDEYFKHVEQLTQRQPSLLLLPEAEKGFLWFYRSACSSKNCLLPLVLGSAPGWDPHTVSAIHAVLRDWKFSNPLDALGLLTSSFADQDVREAAVQEIGSLSDGDLLEYLPQLVQAFKFEWTLESSLVKLLLTRSLQNIRVAHQLYWLLIDALNEAHFKSWYQKLLAALQFCVGKALNEEFSKEKKLLKILEETAVKVKTAQDSKRQEVLKTEINRLEKLFLEIKVCRLVLDPALAITGILHNACSYFTSNAFPLKMSFINADPMGKDINVIFKAGDDLRQDMLVLQLVRVMDRIWLQMGLDMHMIIYKCQSTGKGQGFVQMVPDATTLAKIHRSSGIIGPLKENTIKKWFNHHNPVQASYQKASENFFYSCAGWCVVTFILGVCDRHNDNIMLTRTGHMFHIDFGKFLGHSQTFGSIKRDRAPFIFTSEMEYFITEGGKNPQRFQDFVELCCRAYNLVRKHSHLILNLLDLMLQADLPELTSVQDLKYVYKNLRPQDSDLEATSCFTRKIKESVECFPVKLNNMIHILAQMSFSNPAKSASQSNSQEACTIQVTDRSIRRATVLRFSKTHERLYLVQVLKGNGTLCLTEKTFSQFIDLQSQLHHQFPALVLPTFPSGANIANADLDHKRMQDLNVYLDQMFRGPYDLSRNEHIQRFFLDEFKHENVDHPSFIDPGHTSSDKNPGVQLLISHENQKLTILLKHLKNIHLLYGSAPSTYVEVHLLPDPDEMSRRKTKVVPKSNNPTYNEIVEYYGVLKLQDRVLKLIVKSKGTFIGAVNIRLSSVQLNEERWYPLGRSPY
ncbi:phosphatidylinositol 3-kinase C2 domain-containing subunit gamma [Ambystoma mexicanum]|uniref:phosphatidylinositol 3-kinase C2 domain-containing subunit gamma n=1 Tax=Ambystoma mexicanum TaxID=8296 RepID=UPI0037E9A75F